ncbi:MAG: hypothetical protein ACE15C_02060 [Phycisphaerae bacterium]
MLAAIMLAAFALAGLAQAAPDAPGPRTQPATQATPAQAGRLVGGVAANDAATTPGGVEISFALSEPNDVTVTILDADGRAVRHLASGVVGLDAAAAPLAPKSLSQKLIWDRKDDRGQALAAGKYTVKVQIGLGAKLDKFILSGHDAFLGNISAFGGSNRTGHVFVSNHGLIITSFMKEFDRDGKYAQTVWPFNPNMPKDMLEAFWKASRMAGNSGVSALTFGQRDYDGRMVPLELHGNSLSGPQIGSITQVADGRVIAVTSKGGEGRIEVWDKYGRMMEGWREVPWSMHNRYAHCRDTLTIDADPAGKLVYITDAGRKEANGETGYIVACLDATTLKPVEKFTWSGAKKLDKPVYYLGTLNEPGDDESHLKAPTGSAVDNKGRIWVADAGSLKVFDPEGKFIKRIDAKTPGLEKVVFDNVKIGANFKTGEVFIAVNLDRNRRRLYKLQSLDEPKVVWEIDMPRLTGPSDRNWGHIFVDSQASVVWAAEGAGRLTLLRVQDKGQTFEKTVISGLVDGKLLRPQYMRVDSKGNLFVMDHARGAIIRSDVEGKTWKEIIKSTWDGSSGWFSLDKAGNVYLADSTGFSKNFRIRKFDPEGNQLPIGEGKEIAFAARPPDREWGPAGRINGVCVADNGDIYVAGAADKASAAKAVAEAGSRDSAHELDPRGICGWVNVYFADGQLKTPRLVQMVCPNDVQIGRDGLYLVDGGFVLSPAKRAWGQRKATPWTAISTLQKYSPAGGVYRDKGHLWSHSGVGYVNSLNCSYECPGAQVCVDDDDRIWITEHLTYNFKAVDSAGNLIARLGGYGNADCDGDPGGRNPSPAIPLAWPQAVARYKDMVLVCDQISARIARCKLTWKEEKSVEVSLK